MRCRVGPVIGIALVGFGLLTGCSSGSSEASDPSTSTTVTAPTTASSTTSAPTTTEPSGPTQGATTSADAAGHLVTAWEAHDRAAAAEFATPRAVKGIFATPDPAMWMRGCTPDDSLPQGGCVYRTRSGLVQINTERRKIGWVVTSANYDAFDDGNSVSGNAPLGPDG